MRGLRAKTPDVRIFISYAHRDPPFFFQTLQSLLKWHGVQIDVRVWTDEQIRSGSDPDKAIKEALQKMDIFVALISPMYAASWYVTQVEIPIAKKRQKKDGIEIAPIVVSKPGKGDFKWLMKLKLLPHDSKSWSEIRTECGAAKGENYDEALRVIRSRVKELVDHVRAKKAKRSRP